MTGRLDGGIDKLALTDGYALNENLYIDRIGVSRDRAYGSISQARMRWYDFPVLNAVASIVG